MTDDYIKRSDVLKHKRHYENPDIVDGGPYLVAAVPYEVIESLPAADVVDVTRCKDCKYAVQKSNKLFCKCDWSAVLPFHYCSIGERGDTK